MPRKEFKTEKGTIVYWVNEIEASRKTLVFLPGLTADHRLFDKQIDYFKDKYNVLFWDAPGHGESRPFVLDFSMDDKARWLREILQENELTEIILVGQSMGGYISQTYLELYKGEIKGFVSIDSCSLQEEYVTPFEVWALKHVEGIYKAYPWKSLIKAGAKGCAETEYGQNLMKEMMMIYEKKEYCKLVAHGYKILAEAYESKREYLIDCKAVLICGNKDKAGSAKRINKRWSANSGIKTYFIDGAGHNSNTDKADEINQIIEKLAEDVKQT